MTLEQQIKDEKLKLKEIVLNAVSSFQSNTGLKVTSIELVFTEKSTRCGSFSYAGECNLNLTTDLPAVV